MNAANERTTLRGPACRLGGKRRKNVAFHAAKAALTERKATIFKLIARNTIGFLLNYDALKCWETNAWHAALMKLFMKEVSR
ncbi:hypothetical protein FF011L_27830 [Roseimaritima multifibrata]|uniref:Uncharacterized protein n=1 Tax=Roseimaritima multifibrata TaxID=1930274 RepID=A0A517MGL7_9BACT|nr:hypothetical protein FF011L_27830 [Roseimaritima multifibrata]